MNRDFTFIGIIGVEIECTGLTRAAAAKAISKVLGGSPEHFGGSYDR